MVYLAADHGGFELKEKIKAYLIQSSTQYEDLGATELIPNDDYDDYVLKLVERVRYDEGSRGIVICRNGVGVSMLVNKFKGIRAALSFSPKHVASSRNDDDSNVLALPSDYVDGPLALEIVKTWLQTPFSGADRHIRRVGKVDQFGQE